MKSLSRVRLLATPWTAAYQAPLSMGFSRQEYWSGVPLPSLTAYNTEPVIAVIKIYTCITIENSISYPSCLTAGIKIVNIYTLVSPWHGNLRPRSQVGWGGSGQQGPRERRSLDGWVQDEVWRLERRAVAPPPGVPALEADKNRNKTCFKICRKKRNPESLRVLVLQDGGQWRMSELSGPWTRRPWVCPEN